MVQHRLLVLIFSPLEAQARDCVLWASVAIVLGNMFLYVGTNNLIDVVSDLTKLAIKQPVLVYQVTASLPTYFNRFFSYHVIGHLHVPQMPLPPPILTSIEFHIFWVIWKTPKTRRCVLRMRGCGRLCSVTHVLVQLLSLPLQVLWPSFPAGVLHTPTSHSAGPPEQPGATLHLLPGDLWLRGTTFREGGFGWGRKTSSPGHTVELPAGSEGVQGQVVVLGGAAGGSAAVSFWACVD